MILVFLNWLYISILALIIGLSINKVIKGLFHYVINDWAMVWLNGIMALTVYAQYFSLIYRMGTISNIVLCLLSGGLAYWMRNELRDLFENVKRSIKINKKMMMMALIFIAIVCFFEIITNQKANHADTDGYHVQAIRWIEDYGVVKGIGNLYNRLAYNSAFMCLQALFSWRFLFGVSMHAMNGYLCCGFFLIVLYDLLFAGQKSYILTFFRIMIMVYIVYPSNLYDISSPNSDMMTMLFVGFILYKWVSLLEEKEKNALPYALLSVIAVFTISLKLSAAILPLLAIKPAIMLVKEKRWKDIAVLIGMGILVIAPFLIRNVIISGYLLYPYSGIDLFNVDWKMPASMLDYDKYEIMVWGRCLRDVSLRNVPLTGWLPVWWEEQEMWLRITVIANVISIPLAIGVMIRKIRRKDWDTVHFVFCIIVLFFSWFLSAPLLRYGLIYTIILPITVMGVMLSEKNFSTKQGSRILVSLCLTGCIISGVFRLRDIQTINKFSHVAYNFWDCEGVSWEGIEVYIPYQMGNMGYYFIPSTQHDYVLPYIELRGESIQDGIRVKEQYKNERFESCGAISDWK